MSSGLARTPHRASQRGVAGVLATLLVTLAASAAGLAAAAAPAGAETLWLCKPGLGSNPCLSSEETTAALGNGVTYVQHPGPAASPPIDCFYVYPTVSSQNVKNATFAIEPEEEAIAVSQASRFSQDCNVYAPVYRQLTIPFINGLIPATQQEKEEANVIAYVGVVSAFQEYMTKYNSGRGVVLIGHSQGSAMLEQLIRERVDPVPSVRSQLVSAIILGGQVIVPEGQLVGGTFQHIPGCHDAFQTGCVVAYSSFLQEPPNPSDFGRPESPLGALGGKLEGVEHQQVLCVNPTIPFQNGAQGPLFSYYPTTPFPGLLEPVVQVPSAPTPWVSTPGEYAAQCRHQNGASWLQLNYTGPHGDPREQIHETLGPLWGTHLVDVNVALGNLVGLVRLQSILYRLHLSF
jgi:Protein of unknown function (DUF3089)